MEDLLCSVGKGAAEDEVEERLARFDGGVECGALVRVPTAQGPGLLGAVVPQTEHLLQQLKNPASSLFWMSRGTAFARSAMMMGVGGEAVGAQERHCVDPERPGFGYSIASGENGASTSTSSLSIAPAPGSLVVSANRAPGGARQSSPPCVPCSTR